MAIIPYIHKQILLKDKYRTPQRDFYCLLTTLATCLISIEYGVRCSPGTINEKNMISSRMALTGLLFIDLTSHTLEEKWTAVAYLHVYKPLMSFTILFTLLIYL